MDELIHNTINQTSQRFRAIDVEREVVFIASFIFVHLLFVQQLASIVYDAET